MISTRGRYALRVMIDLAEHTDEGPIPLKEIAERQGVSKKYLEIIVKELVGGGLVEGASGRGGGYRLCRRPEDYSVGEILELTEGSMAAVACLEKGAETCPRAGECRTLPMWAEYDRLVRDFFRSKTLAELIRTE
ncbi:MAG: Rrf2 family transcriptional regulator [Oscillospiraceae bacterium]|nr:Rrf2 family transcriptional regulator [Oscillospiraceae bacterium]